MVFIRRRFSHVTNFLLPDWLLAVKCIPSFVQLFQKSVSPRRRVCREPRETEKYHREWTCRTPVDKENGRDETWCFQKNREKNCFKFKHKDMAFRGWLRPKVFSWRLAKYLFHEERRSADNYLSNCRPLVSRTLTQVVLCRGQGAASAMDREIDHCICQGNALKRR